MLGSLVKLGLGVAGGFALARVLEARAAGVPIELALQAWDTPILRLREDAKRASPYAFDPDAPMDPSPY